LQQGAPALADTVLRETIDEIRVQQVAAVRGAKARRLYVVGVLSPTPRSVLTLALDRAIGSLGSVEILFPDKPRA